MEACYLQSLSQDQGCVPDLLALSDKVGDPGFGSSQAIEISQQIHPRRMPFLLHVDNRQGLKLRRGKEEPPG